MWIFFARLGGEVFKVFKVSKDGNKTENRVRSGASVGGRLKLCTLFFLYSCSLRRSGVRADMKWPLHRSGVIGTVGTRFG